MKNGTRVRDGAIVEFSLYGTTVYGTVRGAVPNAAGNPLYLINVGDSGPLYYRADGEFSVVALPYVTAGGNLAYAG